MAWAALVPVAMQLLKGNDQPQQQPQALPPQPSLGERFAANQAKYDQPSQHSYPTMSNPFSQFPIGGGSRGSNG